MLMPAITGASRQTAPRDSIPVLMRAGLAVSKSATVGVPRQAASRVGPLSLPTTQAARCRTPASFGRFNICPSCFSTTWRESLAGQQRDVGIAMMFTDIAQGAIGQDDVAEGAKLHHQYSCGRPFRAARRGHG